MKRAPKVSVIIATYNRASLIIRSIKSVFNQTLTDFELIIVDDGSTDNTKEILKPLIHSKKIKYIHQENIGPGGARDRGIQNSHGEYIAILDSDDFWCDPKKLEKQVKFLDSNLEYVLVGGGIIIISKNDKEIDRKLYPQNDEKIRNFIFFENPFAHSTVLYRKDAWRKVGGYGNMEHNFSEDWNLWLKFGKIGKFYNFSEYFTCYTQENTQSYYTSHFRCALLLNLKMIKQYRYDYPNFWKSFFYGWASYFYSFFPFKKQLYPLVLRLKKIIFRYKNENSFR